MFSLVYVEYLTSVGYFEVAAEATRLREEVKGLLGVTIEACMDACILTMKLRLRDSL